MPELRPLVDAYARTLPPLPRLSSRSLPAPHPALRRVIDAPGGPNRIAIAPDGTWLAVADWRHGLLTYDVATGDVRIQLLGMTRYLRAIAISPDGARVAGTHDGGRLLVWDVTDSESRLRVDLPDNGTDLAFTPDGATLAVSIASAVHLLDPATGAVRTTLTRPPDAPGKRRKEIPTIERFTIAPDGTWLAVAYGRSDVPTEIWDLTTGDVRVLPEHSDADDVVIAPDGTWLMTITWRRTQVWDLTTGEIRRKIDTYDTARHRAAVAPGGSRVVTVGMRRLQLWDLATGEPGAVLPLIEERWPFAISPDGTWLAQTGFGSIGIWDINAWLALDDPGPPRERRIGALTSAAGTWLVVQDRDKAWPSNAVRLVDVSTGEVRHTLESTYRPKCAVAPDGSWLAVTSEHNFVRLWETASLTERAVLPQHTTHLAVAPDGTWLATWTYDKIAHRWDTVTGALLGTVSNANRRITALAIAPDGTWLAVADSRQEIRIKDVATDRTRRVLRGPTQQVSTVVISPDATWLAAAGGSDVWIWNPATGKTIATLGGHEGYAAGASISPDGAWLASLDRVGVVRVWRTSTWELSAAMRIDDSETKGCQWFADGTGISVHGEHTVFLLAFTPAG